jgi:transglutaminase-like putative cysteine protease
MHAMQRLQIHHVTEYQFTAPVTLQPHRLLLRPREGHDIRIESSMLEISPAHAINWHRDVFDNSVAVVSFLEPAQQLTVASDVIIQHYEQAPLDFVVEDYAVNYPSVYSADQQALQNWLGTFGLAGGSVETYSLLDRINRNIAKEFTYKVREEQGVQPPAQTLTSRSGSCRDYATLFMEACRHLGLASRFVSGYVHGPSTEAGNASTHAWAEVYLPGPGWKGFDPTSGQLAGNEHIPVAVARHPESVPPVAGSFTGPAGPAPTLVVDVRVSTLQS